jgi:hypothetical protein
MTESMAEQRVESSARVAMPTSVLRHVALSRREMDSVMIAVALIVELAGLTDIRRRWDGIVAALFYLENAAPFVGLLECFLSIVKALMAYSDAGASASAQSVLIANIAVALGASAVGCFVALVAHSLKALLVHRMTRS